MMKTCRICEKEQNVENYTFRKDTLKLRTECKECEKEIKRNFYENNKERYKPKYAERGRNTRKWFHDVIREAKNKPCMDCKLEYPYYVMDFDHRENEEKHFNVSQWIRGGRNGLTGKGKGSSRQALFDEIAKCDVVCSNCHRERTHNLRIKNELLSDREN